MLSANAVFLPMDNYFSMGKSTIAEMTVIIKYVFAKNRNKPIG